MLNLLSAVDLSNKTLQLILLIVLIVMIVLLAVLGIVFIVALRKRAPVIKVVMAPPAANDSQPEPEAEKPAEEQAATETEERPTEESSPELEPEPEDEDAKESDDDVEYVTEGKDSVRYDRSFTAKLIQLKDESKEWYGQIKNTLLSYQRVKERTSWKRETFRIGRSAVARIIIRGKTLCLLLAVEPAGFAGTKYAIEDVSATASTADTPSLYRIKGARRAKYAKELIEAVMKELAVYKDPNFEAKDYYMPYEGTMGLMEKGLVRRIVTNSTRTFEIREVEDSAATVAETETASADGETNS